jgi:hypothetical protein
MSKSSALPYHTPFRYSRPAADLQAAFGAQTGNPPIVTVKKEPAGKVKKPAPKTLKASKAAKPAKAKAGVKAKAVKAGGSKASVGKKR